MKILLINDTSQDKNYGCQLTSTYLKKCINKTYPDNVTTSIYIKNLHNIKKFNGNKYPYKNFDKVIINGEGTFTTFFLTTNKIKNNKKMCGEIFLTIINKCYEQNVECHIVNTTISVNKSNIPRIKNILKKCKTISVREPISYIFIKKYLNLPVKLFPDLGVGINQEYRNIKKDNIVLLGGGSIYKMFRFDNNTEKINSIKKYSFFYQSIIDYILSLNYKIYIIDWPSNPGDGDILKKFIKFNKNVIFISKDKLKNYKGYYQMCEKAKLCITGRYHGTIMSYCANCPIITHTSNMWKTEGTNIMYFDGKINDVFDFVTIDKNIHTICNKIKSILNSNSNIDNKKYNIDINCIDNTKNIVPDIIDEKIYIPNEQEIVNYINKFI